MVNSRNGRKRVGPVAVTVLLLAGWAVVVVVAAGARPADSPLLGVQNMGYVFSGLLLVLVVLSLIFVIVIRPRQDGELPPTFRRRQPWFFLAITLLVFWIWQPDFVAEPNDQEQESATTDGTAELLEVGDEPAAESVAQLTDLLLVALAIAVVGGILLLARSRGEEEEAPPALVDDELEADLLVALNEASTELELTDDPRLSVMNAYATLERVLASHERTRLRSETPTEHVRRSVESLRIDPAPLVQLGELYSLARFSEDEITVDQQDDARMALERARDGLAARS